MSRITWEKRTVGHMIGLWCRRNHGGKDLCSECRALLDYSLARLEHCRFGNDKTKCHKCPVHCYRPKMKERMCEVMRWAGPRMIWYHPVAAVKHIMREM